MLRFTPVIQSTPEFQLRRDLHLSGLVDQSALPIDCCRAKDSRLGSIDRVMQNQEKLALTRRQ